VAARARKSILVLDDEPDILTIIKMHLQKSGFAVQVFTDPVLALEHFLQHPADYDIVLSDIRMPGMNGFEFVRKIRAANSQVKVLLMTAFEMHKSDLEKVLPSVKVDGLLLKPMSMREMVTVIERNL
jgi:DNA-binding response OmpR family regulator